MKHSLGPLMLPLHHLPPLASTSSIPTPTPISALPGRGSKTPNSVPKRHLSSSISRSKKLGLRRRSSRWRIELWVELRERNELGEPWASGLAVRVRGDVVPVELEGEAERRTGLKAVLRRWRESVWEVVEVGWVRDWKRFWRVVDILMC